MNRVIQDECADLDAGKAQIQIVEKCIKAREECIASINAKNQEFAAKHAE